MIFRGGPPGREAMIHELARGFVREMLTGKSLMKTEHKTRSRRRGIALHFTSGIKF